MYARCLSGTKGGGSALVSSGFAAIFCVAAIMNTRNQSVKDTCSLKYTSVASSAKHSHCCSHRYFTCSDQPGGLDCYLSPLRSPLDTHGAHVAIAAEFGRRPHPARVNSEAACLARARGACFPSHQHLPESHTLRPPSPACPSLPGSWALGTNSGARGMAHAQRRGLTMGGTPLDRAATRNPSGYAIIDCEPMLVALSRSNMFAHTRANGHERLIEHTVVVRKAAQIQPFLAVPHGSRPSLPRQ